jgi:large subunit ribosomal protein L4
MNIALKTINFDSGKVEDKAQEFKFSGEETAQSPKNIAYTVRWQLARRRSGSAKVKTMSEISGTTAKPHKQKGTGNARQGSKRSVQFVGGRTCHGPTPRSFDFAIPKKIVKKALSDALRIKLEGQDFLLSQFSDEKAKTSKINVAFKNNNIKSALILIDMENKNSQSLALAVRNLKNVKALDANALNVYDLLKFDQVIVDAKTFEDKILKAL